MSYRSPVENENVMETFQRIATANNNAKLEAAKAKASRYVPTLAKDVLKKVTLAAENGEFFIIYSPPFWNPKYWFIWDKVLCSLLKEELEKKNFRCGITVFNKLQVSWGA